LADAETIAVGVAPLSQESDIVLRVEFYSGSLFDAFSVYFGHGLSRWLGGSKTITNVLQKRHLAVERGELLMQGLVALR
jgi:hypothetical protein